MRAATRYHAETAATSPTRSSATARATSSSSRGGRRTSRSCGKSRRSRAFFLAPRYVLRAYSASTSAAPAFPIPCRSRRCRRSSSGATTHSLALDAAGSERVTVVGDTEGGVMAMLLAATFPDRVSALVLVNAFARWRLCSGLSHRGHALHPRSTSWSNSTSSTGGQDPAMLAMTAPSIAGGSPHARMVHAHAAPGDAASQAARRMYRWVLDMDVRAGSWGAISMPTLVLHRRDNTSLPAGRRPLPGGRTSRARGLVEMEGADCFLFHTLARPPGCWTSSRSS